MIVAHHYVVNSGLMQALEQSSLDAVSGTMYIFGAWGKTGINCFVLITGYFMCKSSFSWNKLLRLYLQIVFYSVIIYGIFLITGQEQFSLYGFTHKFLPVYSISDGFTSCFLVFYLLIPFLNILIGNMNQNQHLLLLGILVMVYSVFPINPTFGVTFNYVGWFCILYIVASYIRFYGIFPSITHRQWGLLSLLSVILGAISVLGMVWIYREGYFGRFEPYFFISDSNKLFSLVVAVSSFMYFKDLKIRYSGFINAIGAATFGVLLIHANSDAMREWLWKDTVDCVGHFGDSLLWTLSYSILSVLLIFTVCASIDWLRKRWVEAPLERSVKSLLRPMTARLVKS